jgi:glycosyltransferase involved in cell wall biosynthesis
MRIAVISWSSRRVGGIEDYLSIVIPALHREGCELAFWHEVDTPADRERIQLPPGTIDICAADVGLDHSIRQLSDWNPHVLYVQGVQSPDTEAKLLEIAPAAVFVHTYSGTCVSGTKSFVRPRAVACDRRFGPACLLHYHLYGCGGNDPFTMWRLFKRESRRFRQFSRYAAILTHSDHMRNEMGNHGLPADVLPFPVAQYRPGEAKPRMGPWRLLYAGRMESLKGGHYLIKALPEVVRAARGPVRVTFAGDGRDRPRWQAVAERIQNATSNLAIEFTGWLTQQEVGTLMENVDLLVVPSLWPEPFGAVGPAAGQYGVPAAAFATGGISQWLGDGVSGHLAAANPPMPSGLAGAIVRCLEDPAHYQALCVGARRMAARFTMDRHLPPLVAALDRVKRANGRS